MQPTSRWPERDMREANAAAMDEHHVDREALVRAGYTGPLGTAVFCAVLAVIGALFGSVVFAMLVGALAPDLTQTTQVTLGTATGALFGATIGFLKVRRGNLDALEAVEDREWQRYTRRQRIR